MTNGVLLLIGLLTSHYLADYCLTWPFMIRAKADGKNIWPILLHGAVHALLMGLCLIAYGTTLEMLALLMLLELVTHTAIDTVKGLLTAANPRLADTHHKGYWMLYGFDQLLHQIVVVAIWYLATRPATI